MKYLAYFFALFAFAFLPGSFALARVGLLSSQGIWLSRDNVFAGDTVKIYTIVNNDTYETLSAQVEFFSNGTLIGTAQLGDVPRELAKQLWIEHAFPAGIAHVTVNLTNIIAVNADGTRAPIPANASVTKQVSADFDIDADTDHDGIGDREDTDDDNDGLSDEEELNLGTNPQNPDTDGDGISDTREVELGTDPKKSDTDGDGLSDGQEVRGGTDPRKADTDGDGLSDKDEVARGTNPAVSDTDRDGLSDGQEIKSNTNPLKADSDGDGMSDADELRKGSNPIKKDTDNDGLSDAEETALGTNPKIKDTDGDGVSDGDEKKQGMNPLARPQEHLDAAPVDIVAGEDAVAPAGQVKGEKDFASSSASSPVAKWPFILGSIFSFFLFIIFYGVYLQKKRDAEE